MNCKGCMYYGDSKTVKQGCALGNKGKCNSKILKIKLRRKDLLEIAVRNVFEGMGYQTAIKKALESLKLTRSKAKELLEKGE